MRLVEKMVHHRKQNPTKQNPTKRKPLKSRFCIEDHVLPPESVLEELVKQTGYMKAQIRRMKLGKPRRYTQDEITAVNDSLVICQNEISLSVPETIYTMYGREIKQTVRFS